MRKSGVHNFPAIDRVIYGKAASEALNEETGRLNATRVLLLASRTLNTKTTDEIERFVTRSATTMSPPLTELHSIRRASKLSRLLVRQRTQELT